MQNTGIINNLALIGQELTALLSGNHQSHTIQERFTRILKQTSLKNPWFTAENINHSCQTIVDDLQPYHLEKFLRHLSPEVISSKKVAVILSGNGPIYGFREMLCILLSGHVFIGKQTGDDNELLEFLASLIKEKTPEFSDKIWFEKSILKNFDAIIANDYKVKAEQFKKYFANHPHFQHPRKSSMALIAGDELPGDLENLGKDIFTYFGRSIYNVTRLMIPSGYDVALLFNHWHVFKHVATHTRYMDQYDYNKSVFLMNGIPHFDNGFLLLRESQEAQTPVGCMHFSRYKNLNEVHDFLVASSHSLESVISLRKLNDQHILPGQATKKTLLQCSWIQEIVPFLKNICNQHGQ